MIVKIPKKIPKYFCENCDYQTGNKKDFTKHLSTAKHKMIVNDSKNPQKIPKKSPKHKIINLSAYAVRHTGMTVGIIVTKNHALLMTLPFLTIFKRIML